MPRNITVTFDDGSTHVYQNAPDDVTPEQVAQRAQKEFNKSVKALDGGRQQPSVGVPEMLKRPEMPPEDIRAQAENEYRTMRDQSMRDQYASLNPVEAFAVGAGKSVEDIGQAVKQGGLWLAKQMSGMPVGREIIGRKLAESQREAAESEQTYQMGTPDGTSAGAGRIAGTVLTTAIPGTQATKLSTAQRIASPLLRASVAGAGGGAAGALFTPVTNEGDFGIEKLKQLALGGTVGAVLPPILNVSGRMAKLVTPSQMVREEVERAATTMKDELGRTVAAPFAKESTELMNRTGVQLTPGQASGSRYLTGAEQAFRQNYLTADKAIDADKRVVDSTIKYIDKVMNVVSKKPETAESAGAAVQKTVQDAVKKMVEQRRGATEGMYKAIDQSGAKIKYGNLATELQKIIDEHSGAVDDVSQAIVANAKRKLSEIVKPTKPDVGGAIVDQFGNQMVKGAGSKLDPIAVDASIAAKTRSGFSAQTATGELFKDIDKANNRRLAARLTEAVQKDLEASETVSPLLKDANALWRKHTQRIKQAEESVLGRVVGKELANDIDAMNINKVSPEAVFDKIKKLKPSEARFVKAFIDRHNPEAAVKVKRAMLQESYDAMFETPTSAGAQALPQLSKFVDFAQKNKALGKWFTDQELAQINDGVQIIKRIGDKFGYNSSWTAGQSFFNDLISNPLRGSKDIAAALINARAMEKALRTGTYVPLKPPSNIPAIGGAAIGQAAAQATQDDGRQ